MKSQVLAPRLYHGFPFCAKQFSQMHPPCSTVYRTMRANLGSAMIADRNPDNSLANASLPNLVFPPLSQGMLGFAVPFCRPKTRRMLPDLGITDWFRNFRGVQGLSAYRASCSEPVGREKADLRGNRLPCRLRVVCNFAIRLHRTVALCRIQRNRMKFELSFLITILSLRGRRNAQPLPSSLAMWQEH